LHCKNRSKIPIDHTKKEEEIRKVREVKQGRKCEGTSEASLGLTKTGRKWSSRITDLIRRG